MAKNKDGIEVLLYSSLDEYEIDQICAILKDNNIPFIRKDSGSGSYMNLYMGQSIQEKSVYVNRNDYDKSMELISPFVSEDKEQEELIEEEQVDDDKNGNKKYVMIRRGLGILVLGIPILAIILIMIFTAIY